MVFVPLARMNQEGWTQMLCLCCEHRPHLPHLPRKEAWVPCLLQPPSPHTYQLAPHREFWGLLWSWPGKSPANILLMPLPASK